MIGPFRSRFRLHRNGDLDLRIEDHERELIGELLEQLRKLLMGTTPQGAVDPSMRRLYPTAYPEDPGHDAEYQALIRDQLLALRLEHLDRVEVTLNATTLTEAQSNSWIAVLNDLRLVLGTSLDVSEEEVITSLDPEDPTTHPKAVYHYLGHLLGELIDAVNP